MAGITSNIKASKNISESVDKVFESFIAKTDIPFLSLARDSEIYLRSENIARELKKKCKKLMVLGMGGSSSGGLSLVYALGNRDTVDFWVDTDPDLFRKKLNDLQNLEDVHWLIISKSGKTLEVISMVNFLNQYYQKKGFSFDRYCTVITETHEVNPLNAWADDNKIPKYNHYPVGGRFSALSENGLIPACFSGMDLKELQYGATQALSGGMAKELTRVFLQSFAQKEQHTYFWIYDRRLKSFGYWLLQLWSESLGKGVTKLGASPGVISVPSLCISTRDQHSLLQQIIEGENQGLVCFFRSSSQKDSDWILEKNNFEGYDFLIGKSFDEVHEAEAQATEHSLREKGKSVLTADLGDLNERKLGELVMALQITVGLIGEILNIDAYSQPGVDRGKEIAKSLLT